MVSIPLGVRKGAWTEEEDTLLRKCIDKYGEGKWHLVPARAGLNRCRKSCRLRWLNYLQPNIKRGNFVVDEVDLIVRLHKLLGNRWSLIAGRLPGRTANDVKNYWNTHLRKKYSIIRYESNSSASETSESILVKPQPRTFPKNASCLREKSISANDTRTKENLYKPTQSSLAPDDDDVMQWWETLFANTKEIGEGKSWSPLSVSQEEHVKGLWSEKISPGVKGDDNLFEEKESGLVDVSFEMDVWDLLCSD